MSGVKDFSAGVLSGDMMSGDKFSKLKSNISFRVNSAREMITGIRGSSTMTPMERRSEIRNRRLELAGIKSEDSSSNGSRSVRRSSSGNIGESGTRNNGDSTTPTSSTSMSGEGSPLMSEVDAGTKSRAQERGFGT